MTDKLITDKLITDKLITDNQTTDKLISDVPKQKSKKYPGPFPMHTVLREGNFLWRTSVDYVEKKDGNGM